MTYAIITFSTAAYLFLGTFLLETKNAHSAVVFKVIPFGLGVALLWAGAKLGGFV